MEPRYAETAVRMQPFTVPKSVLICQAASVFIYAIGSLIPSKAYASSGVLTLVEKQEKRTPCLADFFFGRRSIFQKVSKAQALGKTIRLYIETPNSGLLTLV